MSIINGTLVKLDHTEKYIELSTYSRLHGRKGRFFIDPEPLAQWLVHGEGEHYQRDGGYYLFAKRRDRRIHVELLWYRRATESFVMFNKQVVEIPDDVIQTALEGHPVRYLYTEKRARTNLDFQSAAKTIQEINRDKHKRRALSKAMRQSYPWRGPSVTFYNDFPSGSFFFREMDGICGGLILHKGKKKTIAGEFPCYVYSVHT